MNVLITGGIITAWCWLMYQAGKPRWKPRKMPEFEPPPREPRYVYGQCPTIELHMFLPIEGRDHVLRCMRCGDLITRASLQWQVGQKWREPPWGR